MMKILVVEDNPDLSENIHNFLQKEGYVCELVGNFTDASDKIAAYEYDCIVLDIMLPDGNGLKLLEQIKSMNIKSGVVIISAKNSLDDKISGLEIGADDYLTKPFHLPELNARLKAIYRRKNQGGDNVIIYREIE